MPWIQSHQEIRDHPKTRRVARRLGVGIPVVVGHLHLLWHWALDNAADGNLSRFDDEDIADAAMWEGDPAEFVAALIECGPGKGPGFIEKNRRLHDWDEYGGRYGKRVASAKKAAKARWSARDDEQLTEPVTSNDDANAMRPHTERNASALPAHSNRNAEERRGENTQLPTEPSKKDPRCAAAIVEHMGSLGNVRSPGGLRRAIERDQGPALAAWFAEHPDATPLDGAQAILGTAKPAERQRDAVTGVVITGNWG